MGFLLIFISSSIQAKDPLPSWNESQRKQGIINFVEKEKKRDTNDFGPPTECIAVFDNDGTLWVEHPMYV
jgi:hypothetical protein